HHAGAVAFVSPKLVMAGPEASVRKALADRAAGGTGFAKGAGIGRERSRIDRKAVIWALADSSRLPQREPKEGASDAASGIVAAMRSVTFLVFQAVPKADGLRSPSPAFRRRRTHATTSRTLSAASSRSGDW